ncbi:MAG: hypothetical protein JWM11_6241 [Planctomycetaceae bacterium]|nr:hypothetical protein [Planctomycetaceae bacterium]
MPVPAIRSALPTRLLIACIVFFSVATLLADFRGPTSSNNFRIFASSFEHLVSDNNLYAKYPEQYQDIFKYSPTFAMGMFLFGVFPRPVGLLLWNLTNILVFWSGIQGLNVTRRQKAWVLAICFLPLLGALQNSQSNGLVAGSMLLAYNAMESRKPLRSSFCICCGAFTKLFAVGLAPCFLLYSHPSRYVLSLILITVLMVLAPLPLIGLESLVWQYQNWAHQLVSDRSGPMNFSLFTLLERTLGLHCPRLPFIVAGAVILLAPLMRPSGVRTPAFRAMFFSSILLWVVIFNNKAESSTYVIAACGAAIWSLWQPTSRWLVGFMTFFVLLTDFALTDAVPQYLQDEIMMRYALKALPSTLLWIYIEWQLLTYRAAEMTLPPTEVSSTIIVNQNSTAWNWRQPEHERKRPQTVAE